MNWALGAAQSANRAAQGLAVLSAVGHALQPYTKKARMLFRHPRIRANINRAWRTKTLMKRARRIAHGRINSKSRPSKPRSRPRPSHKHSTSNVTFGISPNSVWRQSTNYSVRVLKDFGLDRKSVV